jgi:hypothetical protein
MFYGTYAPNVPIYNAALQKVVNQRRALGQNVFLADMFFAVDYNTMFLSDHVHPNALGLQAIAQEWLARLQAITIRTNVITSTLINGGASWIAAEVHLSSVTNSAMGFNMELIGTGYPLPPPSLSIGWVGDNSIALTWPLSNGSSFSLYSTTNLSATDSWMPGTASVQTHGDQITVTQALDSNAKFFRLQQP